MTGAEVSAAASDVSVVTVVSLVLMAGCVFGMALGFPWHWLVAAVVLFLFASGYATSAMFVLALSATLNRYAPDLLVWLGSLDVGSRGAQQDNDAKGHSKARHKRRTNQKSSGHNDRYDYDDMFARASGKRRQHAPRPPAPDLKAIFGLTTGFTLKELDSKRRKLAKKFHPDLHRSASATEQKRMAEKMRKINAAYETLKSQAV